MREPRHPSLKVVWHSVSPRRRARALFGKKSARTHARGSDWSQSRNGGRFKRLLFVVYDIIDRLRSSQRDAHRTYNRVPLMIPQSLKFWYGCFRVMNDPTAGSPTVTLLRLHLPLNDEVWANSHGRAPMKVLSHDPETSPNHSIGRCDGRCVQRAGT